MPISVSCLDLDPTMNYLRVVLLHTPDQPIVPHVQSSIANVTHYREDTAIHDVCVVVVPSENYFSEAILILG